MTIIILTISIIGQSIIVFSDLCALYGITAGGGGEKYNDPGTCLYFSVITWTTLGYADFIPTPELRVFAATEAIVGYISMSILVAGLVTVFSVSSNK